MKALRFVIGGILGVIIARIGVYVLRYERDLRQYRKQLPIQKLSGSTIIDRLLAALFLRLIRELVLVTLYNMGAEAPNWLPSLQRSFAAHTDASWWHQQRSVFSGLSGRQLVEELSFLEPINPYGPPQLFVRGSGSSLLHPSQQY